LVTFTEIEPGLFVSSVVMTEDPTGLFSPVGPTESPTGLFWTNAGQASCGFCGNIQVGYRDDWTGLEAWLGDSGYDDLSTAPWHDPNLGVSVEFRGILITAIQGLDATPIERGMAEAVCTGGVANFHRDMSRKVRFSAVLIGCSHAGAKYGLNWLTCALRAGTGSTTGLPLRFLSASPEATSADPDTLVRTLEDVILTREPQVVSYGRGYGAAQNRHGNILNIEWEMQAGLPYLWGDPRITVPVFVETPTQTITWVTGCVPGGGACVEPVTILEDPLCPSPSIPVVNTAPDLGCGSGSSGACVPLCSGSRLSAEYDPGTAGSYGCGEAVVDLVITNNDVTDLRGLTLWWTLVGGDPECEAISTADISYIPAGATLTLDGRRGRVTALVGGNTLQAPGIVSGAGGSPWSPASLDPSTLYELVMAAPTGADVTITVLEHAKDA
jgi:hypothetical protein